MVLATLVSCYLLILAGSIVRASGSGLGCPDWPTCFGHIIPPTSVEELPQNYQELFAIGGQSLEKFNALKTWTEYLNRLLGVIVGIEMLFLVILSIGKKRSVFFLSLGIFILTGTQGWIGAKVVSSLLNPWVVTLHVLLALVILLGLHALYEKTRSSNKREAVDSPTGLQTVTLTVLLLSFLQVIFGVLVRQDVDTMINALPPVPRELWIENLKFVFDLHRTNALILLFSNIFLCFKLKKIPLPCFVLIAAIVSGSLLNYYGFPRMAQPAHLLSASLYLGCLFSFFLRVKAS